MKKRSRETAASSSATASALSHLLGDAASATFFDACWEQKPLHVSGAQSRLGLWRTLPSWETLLSVLQSVPSDASVLALKDQHPTTEYASPAHAYLDACSLIVNHAEEASEGVSNLCKALRIDFPHAFGNLYVTPPSSQAVDAHADDRDVIVLQLEGTKHWRVFGPPPIAFPSRDEQVGKGGRAVPPEASGDERVVLQATLKQGDVLYIPRGFVHEATTAEEDASLHLTLALPSADWSWAAVAAACKPEELDEASLRSKASSTARGEWFWRRAIPPSLGCPDGVCSHRSRAASRKQVMHLAVSVEAELGLKEGALQAQLTERAAAHNARQAAALTELQARRASAPAYASPSSFVRRRRDDEPAPPSQEDGGAGGGGLQARAEIADALVQTLSEITTKRPVRISTFADVPLLCPFGKACFAHVCIANGLLVLQPPLLPPSVPLDVAEPVEGFHHALLSIEHDATRLLRRPWSEVCPEDAPPLERARKHLTVAYTVNSLYWMYLRTKGAKPAEMQKVKAELIRIQKYLAKLKAAEAAAGAAPPGSAMTNAAAPAAAAATSTPPAPVPPATAEDDDHMEGTPGKRAKVGGGGGGGGGGGSSSAKKKSKKKKGGGR